MNWEQVIFELIIELGDFTAIAIFGLKFIGKTFEYKISKQYEAKLNQKLELYKKTIENVSYVSKVRFDANFTVCCEVSERLIYCFDAIQTITPIDGYGIDQEMEIDEINKIIDDLKRCVYRSMPVLSKELYNELNDLIHLFYSQVLAYQALYADDESEDINLLSRKELELKEENICELLHQYYNSLCVTLN